MTISSLVRSSTSCVRLNWDFWHRGTMVCDKTSLPYWGCQPRSYAQRRNPKVLIWQRADSESGFFGWLWIAWIWAVGTWPKRTQSGWNNQKKKPLSTVISCYICTYSTPIFAGQLPILLGNHFHPGKKAAWAAASEAEARPWLAPGAPATSAGLTWWG